MSAYLSTATVPALETQPSRRVALDRPAVESPRPALIAKPSTYQQSLFTSRDLPRTPLETISSPTAQIPPPPARSASYVRHRVRRVTISQQKLEFSVQVRSSKLADGAIYCDAPVAIPAHRAVAAALDGSMILIAIALFGSVFFLAGGQVILNSRTIPLFVAVAAALVACYRLVWCLAERDSPGVRWAHLKMIDFDGHTPTRRQRLSRTASGFLSLAAGGLGLVWGLVDEETLTWHDHISKTFPTPR